MSLIMRGFPLGACLAQSIGPLIATMADIE